jgi:hypothetical protein
MPPRRFSVRSHLPSRRRELQQPHFRPLQTAVNICSLNHVDTMPASSHQMKRRHEVSTAGFIACSMSSTHMLPQTHHLGRCDYASALMTTHPRTHQLQAHHGALQADCEGAGAAQDSRLRRGFHGRGPGFRWRCRHSLGKHPDTSGISGTRRSGGTRTRARICPSPPSRTRLCSTRAIGPKSRRRTTHSAPSSNHLHYYIYGRLRAYIRRRPRSRSSCAYSGSSFLDYPSHSRARQVGRAWTTTGRYIRQPSSQHASRSSIYYECAGDIDG